MQQLDHIAERKLLGFVHLLRAEKFNISINEAHDSIQSLSRLSIPDQNTSRTILRALFCSSIDEWQTFNNLFQQYWHHKELIYSRKNTTAAQPGLLSNNQSNTGFSGNSELQKNHYDTNVIKGSGAGKQNTISKADYRFISNKREMRKVEYLAERLSDSIGRKLKRIYYCKNSGQQLDMRNTLRANLSCSSLLFKRRFHHTKKKPPQLVIFHDVSHSMSWNNPLLFRFARGLARNFNDCYIFAFHTELVHVTNIYKLHSLNAMREKLENYNKLLIGGTSIATSLHKYNSLYQADIQKQNAIVLVISDGFDSDTPESLASALHSIKRRAKKLFWLSPMLNNPAYQPDTETMQYAAKHIDALLPCSSLANLEQATRYLSSAC